MLAFAGAFCFVFFSFCAPLGSSNENMSSKLEKIGVRSCVDEERVVHKAGLVFFLSFWKRDVSHVTESRTPSGAPPETLCITRRD